MSKSGKVLLNTAFVLGAVTLGLFLSRQPWQVYKEQKAISDKAQQEMRAAEQDRAKNIRDGAALQSPLGLEEAARSRGYRKSNEKPLDIHQ